MKYFYDTLRKQAHWTHGIIYKGFFHQLGVMEETLTDIHLLSIADSFPDFVITKKFTRREEGSRSGADWLWLIGEPGSWIPLLIQAKIINPKTGNCQRLDYNKGEQRKKLLAFARQYRFIPLYLIYSYIPSTFKPPVLISKNSHQKEDWACSFISPRTVRLLSKQGLKHQNDVLAKGIPWMDPFFQFSSERHASGQSIANALMTIQAGLENERKLLENSDLTTIQRESLSKNRISWENLDARHAVASEIPRIIYRLINDAKDVSEAPVSGVSILSTIPIKQIREFQGM